MEKNYDKKWIFWFNKNKTKELYEEVLNDKFKDAPRCIHCHKPIYYYDSTFRINQYDQFILKNKSYLSTKQVLGKTYNLCVCEDCLIKKFPEYQSLNKSRVFNRICEITNYAYNIPYDAAEDWKQENYAITEDNLIKKHGEKEGKRRWKEYCDKQAESNTFEYKHEKFGWTREQFDEFNQSRAVTLDNLIKKHGEEEGTKIWEDYCEKQRYSTTLKYFIEKYGKENGEIKFRNFVSKHTFKSGYSIISQKIFDELKKHLNYKLYYATHNNEYLFIDENNDQSYLCDFYIEDLNFVIEFNGDVWHANPSIYKEDDITVKFKDKPDDYYTAKYIWEKDEKRISFLKTKVKHLIIIWEKDFRKKGLEVVVNELLEQIKSIENNG